MNLLRKAFACVAGLSITVAAFAQQPGGTGTSNGEAGVAALRALASNLEKCQDAFVTERHWGKGRSEVERIYLSRPKNIVWRTVPVAGAPRSAGYLEFSSSIYVRVPAESAKKYARKRLVEAAQVPVASDGVAFVPMIDGFPIPDTQYRYEFDLRPEGIALTKMSETSADGTWQVVDTGHPCAPRPK
jgi:hypothetical protein